ncbi:MAG: T9SS type A sorting domain-containing protein [Bacteroidota bacterium]
MKKTLFAFIAIVFSMNSWGQTFLISPTGDGGFESGTTFAANGWTEVQAAADTKKWWVGTAAGAQGGTQTAFVGSSTTNTGIGAAKIDHFYRDVTIPAGAINVYLNFYLKEATVDSANDFFYVFTTTTTNTPVTGTVPSTGYVQRFVNSATAYPNFTAMPQIDLTSLAGTTVRIVFTYSSNGVHPNATPAVDNISLVYTSGIQCSGTPTAGTASPALQTACSGNVVSLSLAGYSTDAGINFQWQQSANGTSGWANVTGGVGATSSSYTSLPIYATTYFRCVLTCTNSTLTSNSNSVQVNVGSPISFPWSENFDTLSNIGASIVPSCWKVESGGGTPWATMKAASSTYNDPYSAPNYIGCNSTPINPSNYLITPPFYLTTGNYYELKFKYAGDGYQGWTGEVRSNTVQTGLGSTLMGTEFLSSTTTTVTTYDSVSRTFFPSTSGTYYFIIHVTNVTGPLGYLGLDNFSLTENVLAVPTITSLGSSSGCIGSSLTINGTNLSGATAVTIGGVAATITANTGTSITVTIGSGTTGTVSVTTPGGTANSTSTFTVNPALSAPGAITNDGPKCAGTAITFTKGSCTAGSCYWVSSAAGTETTNSATTYTSPTAAGTYVVWVRAFDGSCWSSAVTSTATIAPLPVAPTVGTITQPTCTLTTGSVVLSGLPNNGSWTITRTPGAVTSTGSGTTSTISGIPTGTYTFTVTNSSGCVSLASANVVINAAPTPPTAPVVTRVGNVLQSNIAAGNQWYNLSGLISGATLQNYTVTADGTYFDIVTVSGCKSDSSNFIVVTNMGIDGFTNSNALKIYPNPVTNELTIEMNGNTKTLDFEILNSLGEVVLKDRLLNKVVIPVSNLSRGIYLIKLENGETFEFRKVIKE